VFPEYYSGQIFEAKHEPGTIAYSRDLQLIAAAGDKIEMARNVARNSLASTAMRNEN